MGANFKPEADWRELLWILPERSRLRVVRHLEYVFGDVDLYFDGNVDEGELWLFREVLVELVDEEIGKIVEVWNEFSEMVEGHKVVNWQLENEVSNE